MVKLNSPMLSFEAKGNFGKTINFSKNGKTQYARKIRTSKSSQSLEVNFNRLVVSVASAAWNGVKRGTVGGSTSNPISPLEFLNNYTSSDFNINDRDGFYKIRFLLFNYEARLKFWWIDNGEASRLSFINLNDQLSVPLYSKYLTNHPELNYPQGFVLFCLNYIFRIMRYLPRTFPFDASDWQTRDVTIPVIPVIPVEPVATFDDLLDSIAIVCWDGVMSMTVGGSRSNTMSPFDFLNDYTNSDFGISNQDGFFKINSLLFRFKERLQLQWLDNGSTSRLSFTTLNNELSTPLHSDFLANNPHFGYPQGFLLYCLNYIFKVIGYLPSAFPFDASDWDTVDTTDIVVPVIPVEPVATFDDLLDSIALVCWDAVMNNTAGGSATNPATPLNFINNFSSPLLNLDRGDGFYKINTVLSFLDDTLIFGWNNGDDDFRLSFTTLNNQLSVPLHSDVLANNPTLGYPQGFVLFCLIRVFVFIGYVPNVIPFFASGWEARVMVDPEVPVTPPPVDPEPPVEPPLIPATFDDLLDSIASVCWVGVMNNTVGGSETHIQSPLSFLNIYDSDEFDFEGRNGQYRIRNVLSFYKNFLRSEWFELTDSQRLDYINLNNELSVPLHSDVLANNSQFDFPQGFVLYCLNIVFAWLRYVDRRFPPRASGWQLRDPDVVSFADLLDSIVSVCWDGVRLGTIGGSSTKSRSPLLFLNNYTHSRLRLDEQNTHYKINALMFDREFNIRRSWGRISEASRLSFTTLNNQLSVPLHSDVLVDNPGFGYPQGFSLFCLVFVLKSTSYIPNTRPFDASDWEARP